MLVGFGCKHLMSVNGLLFELDSILIVLINTGWPL